MGTTGSQYPKGTPTKQIVEDLEGPMLASAMRDGVFYGVFENREGQKMAFVSPIRRERLGWVYVKSQDESMGPYDAKCPDKLLDMLDPPVNEWAAEWRANCRSFNDRERAAKAVTEGTVIVTAPVNFGKRYGTSSRFRYTGTGARFIAMDGGLEGRRVNLTNAWRSMPYTIEV